MGVGEGVSSGGGAVASASVRAGSGGGDEFKGVDNVGNRDKEDEPEHEFREETSGLRGAKIIMAAIDGSSKSPNTYRVGASHLMFPPINQLL